MDITELRKIKKEEYQFYYDPINPDTLVALKKLQFFPHLNIQNNETFANIIVLPNAMTANIYRKNLLAMIKQPVASEVMIKQFCNLARFRYPDLKGQIRQFQRQTLLQVRDHQINQGQYLLREYVRQTFFHKLLNNLLRTSRDSFEIFYAHQFVKKMHYIIKQKYKISAKKSKKLICYRGCRLTKDQINNFKQNQGKYIETLGFLSTSLSEKIAMKFVENAIFEIIVTDELNQGQFDQGFLDLQNNEMEVLFNVLCSFEILEVTTVKKFNLQILKIKLKYGELARLMSKYNKKQQINFTDIQNQVIISVAHQSLQNTALDQQGTFEGQSIDSINYLETLLKVIENCPLYNPNKKKFIEVRLLDTKNIYLAQNFRKIVLKTKKIFPIKVQGPISVMEFIEQMAYLRGMAIESEQFQAKGSILVQRVLKAKQSMTLMKDGIEKDKNLVELAKILRVDIGLLLTCLQVKTQLKKYSYDQLFKDIHEIKQRIKFLFGEIHPYYTQVLELENSFQKLHIRKNDNKTFQKWKQFLIRKQTSSPQTLPKQYVIMKQFQKQAYSDDPKNWKYILCNQKYNKRVNASQNYSNGLKQRIHQSLFQLFHRECGSLFHANKFFECEKLIKCMKNNRYYNRPFHDENLAKIKIHQTSATMMYTQNLEQMVKSDKFKMKQCLQYIISVMNYKLNNINMNLGKDSNLYIAHRCYHIMVLKMLGQYEEAENIYLMTLQEIVESSRDHELRQFIIDQLKEQNQ